MSLSIDANAQSAPRPRGRQPGWYIPWIFVGFLAFVAVVNFFFVYMATSTFNGLQTENHYIKGIKYNSDLAGAKAQAERGWRVDLAFTSDIVGHGVARVSLRDRNGQPLAGGRVRVQFMRPTQQGFDQVVAMEEAGNGQYLAAVDFPLSGVWDMRLGVEHPSGDYQDQQRIWVK